jgi:DNA-binding PadR family transcriptional regulator
MLLETDQRRYLAMLTLGHSICRTDRIVQPLLLRIPPFPLKKGAVTDEDLKAHMSKYSDLAHPENSGIPRKSPIRDIQKDETPTPLGRILLENIALEPVLGLVQRFRKLGLKTAEGYKVLRELEDKGLITPSTVDGKRLYGLTTTGRNALGLRLSQTGRGGVEHRYWVEAVKAHYLKEEGFTFIEKDDLDLVVESYEKRLAIQMETGKSDLQGNIMKLGRYRADLKFILATNRSTETRLKNLLRDLLVPDREAIQVAFVKDFLANPPSL